MTRDLFYIAVDGSPFISVFAINAMLIVDVIKIFSGNGITCALKKKITSVFVAIANNAWSAFAIYTNAE